MPDHSPYRLPGFLSLAPASLGNVPPGDILALEALRRGLRGDTIHLLSGPAADRSQPTSEGAARR